MDGISSLSAILGVLQVVGSATIAVYKYAASVKGAPAACDRLLQELSAIGGTLGHAKVVLDGLQGQDDFSTNHTLKIIAFLGGTGGPLESCRATIDELCAWLARDGDKRMRVDRRMLWPFQEKDLMEFVQRLERHKTHFILALSLNSADSLMHLGNSVEDVKKEQQRVKDEKARQELQMDIRDLIKWLSPLDVDVKHESSSRIRQPGTGTWLLDNKLFREWRSSNSGFLWLHGIPGSGKTILMSTVIDELKSSRSGGDEEAILAYYYCDFSDSKSANPVTVLRTLLTLFMATIDDDSVDTFEDLLKRKKASKSPPDDIELLQSLLLRAIGERKAIIVLDALDECVDRRWLLEFIPRLVQQASVRWLVSSRREQDIVGAFEDFPTISLSHEFENVYADIQTHIMQKLETEPRLRRLDSELKAELGSALLHKADGMFRWVQCQLDFIVTRRTRQSIREALRTLPRGLYPTYERILKRIEDEGEESALIAKKTLLWLVSALRPLKLVEVEEAIMIEVGSESLNDDARVLDKHDILEICSSLVDYDDSTDIVSVSHYSVQEFLLSNYLADSSLQQYYILLPQARRELALLSLTYLLLDDFDSGQCESLNELSDREAQHPFFWYAAVQSFLHVQSVEEDDEIFTLMKNLLIDQDYRERYLAFRQVFHMHDFPGLSFEGYIVRDRLPSVAVTPLYELITCSLQWVTRRMIKNNPTLIDTEIEGYGTPLTLATFKNLREMAALLIELGADVNKTTRNHYAGAGQVVSPLLFAVQLGRVEIFAMLLEHGAKLELPGGSMGYSLIFLAAFNGQTPMLEELIRRGVDANMTAGDAKTALHYAVEGCSLDCVRALVEAGCNVSDHRRSGKTPLEIAFTLRSTDIIQYLLDHGASAKDFGHLSPDQCEWAASEPWFPILQNNLAELPEANFHVPESSNDVFRVRDMMHKALRLPVDIICSILDYAEYWVRSSVSREDYIIVDKTIETPYVSIEVTGRPHLPLRRVIFETRSHDQGWSDNRWAHGSYRYSYTWFEAGQQFTASDGPQREEPRRHMIQTNVHGSSESRVHINTWAAHNETPELAEWMDTFRPGDVLHVFPRASFSGWENHVESVKVDAFCAWV
ncbi:hypothetical protein SCP_1203930 [Sparassis crispa]|uniref:NACHT domain-containing protein n=1 Tax=Sparassis crispa TaxID=139825 RepID=A0A401H191_9APHY|nr:hypothetical protein SCP_1203930 [Sparassis crispa]GBE88163.1 hypothetical protein SCP_1203930 [Sparassis crispa]